MYSRSFEMLPWNTSPMDTELTMQSSIYISTVIDFLTAQHPEDAEGAE